MRRSNYIAVFESSLDKKVRYAERFWASSGRRIRLSDKRTVVLHGI